MSTELKRTNWDAFISYSRRDKEFVQKLAHCLEAHNYTPWVDWNDIPLLAQWREEIRQGILASNNFIFILSPDSLTSKECAKELEWAIIYNKRLVPILYCDIKSCPVPQPLAEVNWVIFKEDEEFEQSFQQLLQALDTDLEHIKIHTRLLTRADEWDSQQRDDSFLLRGTDLNAVETWLLQQSEQRPSPVQLQRDYVTTSRIAETRRQKKEMQNQRIALGSVISALAIVTVLGLFTEARRREAVMSEITALNAVSQASLALKTPLEAMMQGLKASIQLQQAHWIRGPLKTETLSALGQASYWVQERNRLEGHNDWVYGVEFSPDGQSLASVSLDGTLKLWQLDGRQQATLQAPGGGKVIDVSFSPDGQLLATGGEDAAVRLWSRDGTLLHTLAGHESWIYKVAFSPDGKTLASASLDGTVRVWQADGAPLQVLSEHPGPVLSVGFNPVNSTLVSGSQDGTLKLWQPDGTVLQTFNSPEGIFDAGASPDGTIIASAGKNGLVRLWRPDGSLIRTLQGGTDSLRSLDFSPDGQFIAAAGHERAVYIWRLDGTLVTRLPGHQATIQHVAFSPDGTLLATASEDLSIRLWQWNNPWMEQLRGHSDWVNSVGFNARTQEIVSGSEDGTLKLWTEQGQLVKTLPSSMPGVNKVAVSPDGNWIAAVGTTSEDSVEGLVRLWTATGEDRGILGRQGNWVSAVAFSPDSQLVATGDNTGIIHIRNLSGESQQTLEYGFNLFALAFSPNGRFLAAAGEGSVKVWDTATKELTHTYIDKGTSVYGLSFSPDSQILVFANSDRTVGLWPLEDAEPRLLEGHRGEVYAVQFSPDGSQFASAGQDQTIRLWSPTGDWIATIGNHAASIYGLQFNADGSKLVSGSEDQTLMIWEMSILNQDALIQNGCSWLEDYLRHNPQVPKADQTVCRGVKPWP